MAVRLWVSSRIPGYADLAVTRPQTRSIPPLTGLIFIAEQMPPLLLYALLRQESAAPRRPFCVNGTAAVDQSG
jgi:hypothetical protein